MKNISFSYKVAAIAILMQVIMPLRGQGVYKYWVRFTDKAGSAYTLANPEAFLSQRALQRRAEQRIVLDSLDLPVSLAYLQTLADMGYGVQHRSRWFNGAVVYSATDSVGAQLAQLPCIREVQPLGRCSLAQPPIPITPIAQYSLSPYQGEPYGPGYYGYGYDQIEQLSGIELHRRGYEGQGILIGVCDGGFPGVDSLLYFDSLRSSGRLLATRDFVWQGDSVFSQNGHGTLVLSNLTADIPGVYVGTAPKASYVLCRTENTYSEGIFEEYNWVAAAEYLDSLGVDLITSSLGYFYFDDSTTSHTLADLDGRTAPMTQAAEIAFSRGILVVNSAGNDGESDPQHLNVPADAQNVLTVGAATHEGETALFSSYGPTADLRIKPDVLALGQAVPCVSQTGDIIWANGTSMAGPIMAGMVACLMQRYPEYTPLRLCDSVRSWGNMAQSPDLRGGYGIPDFSRAFQSDTVVGIQPIEDRSANSQATIITRDYITFETGDSARGEIVLIDMQGRECLRCSFTQFPTQRIDISFLPAGTYVARIDSVTFKVVKM